MYSVIECGGFQHKITLGETLKVSKINAEVGQELTLSNVLLYADGGEVKVGLPHVADSSVKVEVLFQGRDDKIIVFKRKRRKRYRKTIGHRQSYTEILVKEISCAGEKKSIDEKLVDRARARIAALIKQKAQNTPLTRAQKVAAASAVSEGK